MDSKPIEDYYIDVIEVDCPARKSWFTKVKHGENVIGRSFVAVMDGVFPCKGETNITHFGDQLGSKHVAPRSYDCQWCAGFMRRILSRRYF